MTASNDGKPPEGTITLPPSNGGSRTAPGVTLPEHLAFAPALPWQVGFLLLDEFEVEGELGRGGMGIVYRVRQLSGTRTLAVKRARLARPDARRLFLAELQLWVDLPDHPHLAPCRFFRTIADEIVIFTDLALGGSLADWIVRGQLDGLPPRLDVAIQVARGLHALHERGLVHQDVKPANVLMSAAGDARVADFGLARARARALPAEATTSGATVVVSGGAMTPAYCSPEQALGRPVTRRTDIWSWGVLVLEMFVGRVPCCERGGPYAAETLERHLGTPGSEPLPADLAALLRRCFAGEPAERWPSLAEVTDELTRIYRAVTGVTYPRPAPVEPATTAPGLSAWREEEERRDSPRWWLGRAYTLAGRDATEVEAALPPPATTRRGQAVADLAVFEEARQLVETLVGRGRRDVLPHLGALFVHKAAIHASVGDWPGALDLLDRASSLWQELISYDRRHEVLPSLLRTWLHRAAVLRGQGEMRQAIALCDEVIARWNRLDNRRARQELRQDLAAALFNKGQALRGLGQTREAIVLYGKAIDLFDQLVTAGQQEHANSLAQAHLALATALSATGAARLALEHCDRAIALRKRLLQRDDRPALAGDLARAFVHKATVLRASDEPRAAVALYEQAVALYRKLVEHEGRDDLAHDLARAWLARANADRALGDAETAADCCARAAAIWQRLVEDEGRTELTPDLARAWQHRASCLRKAGRAEEGLPWSQRALALWERIVLSEGNNDLGNDLARAWVGQAGLLRALGQHRQAHTLFEKARDLRQALLDQRHREDIEGDLVRDGIAWAELLHEMGQTERARADLEQAITRLEEIAPRTGRSDLQVALRRAYRLRRLLTS